MFQEEHLYALALRASPLVGDITFMRLVEAAGSAREAWRLSKRILREIPGIGAAIASSIGDEQLLFFAEKELRFCEKNSIRIRLRHRRELPRLLSACEDAPAVLYEKGSLAEEAVPVSMVGTRNMTAYGRAFVEEFIHLLKGKNVLVVSGLALGTDGCAHTEALKNRLPTAAVLAHGLHTLYPSAHYRLAQEMLERGGALLTEFTSRDKPDREHFLQRNRIIAGLSPLTVVVETAYGGGSVSTVSYANDYNREVYALPGKIQDKYSQGCNQLIAQNKARIINRPADLLEELGLHSSLQKTGSLFAAREVKLHPDVQPIYDCIAQHAPITLDELSEKLRLPPYRLLPILLDLELNSYIKALSGKQYALS